MVSTPEWTSNAECAKGYDPDLWHAGYPGSVKLAKKICSSCPVKLECLNYGLETTKRERINPYKQHSGIYGGLTDMERARLAMKGN